jgi:hypothetical protein
VTGLDARDRRPRARELWGVHGDDTWVLTASTPEGIVEFAVAAQQVDWLRDQLTGDRDATG